MTERSGSLPYLAHVHFVHISPIFASPEGEGFSPSPMVTLGRLTQAGYPVAELSLYKPGYFSGTLIRPIPASWMETAS